MVRKQHLRIGSPEPGHSNWRQTGVPFHVLQCLECDSLLIFMGSSVKNLDTSPEFLDVKWLRLFDLIYKTGSVTRAAEQLGQSQPTVSIWLSKLRSRLHDPLFVRTSGGMEPTPRAQALIETTRDALESMRRITEWQPSFEPAKARRKFRICMTDASHITLLPNILSHVRAIAPNVALEATRIDADTGRALSCGDADLALGLIPDLESGFYQQSLYDQDWVCLANSRHPRVSHTLSLRQYKEEAHVAIAAGTGSSLLAAAFKRQGIDRRVLLELPGFLGLPAIISTTDLIATLPRQIGETLARTAGLAIFPSPVPTPSFTVKQHWHLRYHEDPANRWLRSVCATLFLRKGSATRKR